MTELNAARETVYKQFLENFDGVEADKVTLENEQFTPPEDDAWVRVSLRNGLRNQETLGNAGNRRFNSAAIVFVQVFVPLNSGTQQMDQIAKKAANVFEGKNLSGLAFRGVSIRETGPDGKWYGALVEAPCDYEEIK